MKLARRVIFIGVVLMVLDCMIALTFQIYHGSLYYKADEWWPTWVTPVAYTAWALIIGGWIGLIVIGPGEKRK